MRNEQGEPTIEDIVFTVDPEWLDKRREEILEPDLPIIDPHHHLWDYGSGYLFNDVLADVRSGHNVRATVHVECAAMYRADGDPLMAPVGETEFVNGIAAMSASGRYGPVRLCAGIVAYADFLQGERVAPVLEAHLRASDRVRGLRNCTPWDADETIRTAPTSYAKGMLLEPKFREAFALLGRRGLSYDAWLLHPQIPELANLAAAFPSTPVVLDHVGGPLGIGVYAGRRDDVFESWRASIRDLAQRPNTYVKLGGMGMNIFGFGFDRRGTPPSSEDLAGAWRPFVENCIEAFGVNRCMFESNFPVDKRSYSYPVMWNAFKRLASGCSQDEKTALFSGTARQVYRLDVV